jgi:hypothetical protein
MPDTFTGELANLMALLDDPANVILAHLAQNNISPLVDSVQLTDFTECNFAGYAPIRVVNTIPFESDTEIYGDAISQPLLWTPSGIAAPQMISAVYVTIARSGGPAELIMVDIFSSAVVISTDAQSFAYELHFEMIADESL